MQFTDSCNRRRLQLSRKFMSGAVPLAELQQLSSNLSSYSRCTGLRLRTCSGDDAARPMTNRKNTSPNPTHPFLTHHVSAYTFTVFISQNNSPSITLSLFRRSFSPTGWIASCRLKTYPLHKSFRPQTAGAEWTAFMYLRATSRPIIQRFVVTDIVSALLTRVPTCQGNSTNIGRRWS